MVSSYSGKIKVNRNKIISWSFDNDCVKIYTSATNFQHNEVISVRKKVKLLGNKI